MWPVVVLFLLVHHFQLNLSHVSEVLKIKLFEGFPASCAGWDLNRKMDCLVDDWQVQFLALIPDCQRFSFIGELALQKLFPLIVQTGCYLSRFDQPSDFVLSNSFTCFWMGFLHQQEVFLLLSPQ